MPAIKLKNKTISITESLRAGVMELQRAHIQSASLDARLLLEHVLGVSREELLLAMEGNMSQEQESAYLQMIAERAQRKPIAHLLGKREFWGMNFQVTENTLDPRPDSETLIDALLERFPDRAAPLRLLDMGTGTGCLLLSLLKEFHHARGTGIDISEKALAVARRNAEQLGLDDRTEFCESNWAANLQGEFDIIISNPPYIPSGVIPTLASEVCQYEPMLALDGGQDGLDCYREIMPSIQRLLTKDGVAIFEIGAGQQNDLQEIAVANGLNIMGMKKDLSGIVRCVLVNKNNLNS